MPSGDVPYGKTMKVGTLLPTELYLTDGTTDTRIGSATTTALAAEITKRWNRCEIVYAAAAKDTAQHWYMN